MAYDNIRRYTCDVKKCENSIDLDFNSQTTGPEGWAFLNYHVFGGSIEELFICNHHRKTLNVILFADQYQDYAEFDIENVGDSDDV